LVDPSDDRDKRGHIYPGDGHRTAWVSLRSRRPVRYATVDRGETSVHGDGDVIQPDGANFDMAFGGPGQRMCAGGFWVRRAAVLPHRFRRCGRLRPQS